MGTLIPQNPMRRRPLLKDIFRVWCGNVVADYQVVLTRDSLILLPAENKRKRARKNSSSTVEIPGKDVVACRPASASALSAAAEGELGPPVLALVTYQRGRRATLYFHWRVKRRDEGDDESGEVRLLVDLLRVKEQWVGAIHKTFLPLRPSPVTRPGRALLANFFCAKLLVAIDPNAGEEGAALRTFKEKAADVFKDADVDYEVDEGDSANVDNETLNFCRSLYRITPGTCTRSCATRTSLVGEAW